MADPLILRTPQGDEQLDLVDFETRVRRGELLPSALVRHPVFTGDRFVPAGELELYRRLHEPRRAHFTRVFSLWRFPWLTFVLIFLNLAVFLATTGGGQMELDAMVRFGAKVGPLVADLGQVWRLLTANFLHRDWVHLSLNMFVLFQVGGALENTYRALDYLWLLVFTGLSTMATSLLFNHAVTIGASGMVFGCLGAMVAFGLKYKSVLPARYRRILGDGAIPTVLGLLLIGLTSKGVDNWAHIGGLVAGVAVGALVRPELLVDRRVAPSPVLRALPTLGLVSLALFGQWALEQTLPSMRIERDDDFGLSMPIPRGWKRGANPLGSLAWYNGLPGVGRASVAGEAVEAPEGADLTLEAARFVEERLSGSALGPNVIAVEIEKPEAGRVGDRDAVRVSALITEAKGNTRLKAWFIARGSLVFQLVFLWPDGLERYGAIADEMAQGLRFVERKALRVARGEALVFPNSPAALARLGIALREEGAVAPAVEALQAAVRGAPDVVRWRVALSRALMDQGEVERACQAAHDALAYDELDPGALEADARCELGRGNTRRALERLEEARAAVPGDERLKAAAKKLRASVSELK